MSQARQARIVEAAAVGLFFIQAMRWKVWRAPSNNAARTL
jgi:hypothetical protein